MFSSRFGCKTIGKRTGIVFNNHMADFSLPGNPMTAANCIVPGKRPNTFMSPTIVTDKNGDVKLVTGGSGGTRIINVIVQVSTHFTSARLILAEKPI